MHTASRELSCHYTFYGAFVNTEFNNKRLLKTRGLNALDGLPDFRFESIPDGLPPSDASDTRDGYALFLSTKKNFLDPFRDLVVRLNSSKDVPPVTCIVSDGFMTFSIAAAKELGIPILLFFTISACSFMGFKHFLALKEKGLVDESYKTNGYLDTIIDWIPGMKGIRLRDLPSFLRTTNPNDVIFDMLTEAAEKAHEASAIIIHTFEALESEVLDGLSTIFPRVYAIGSIQLLLCEMRENRLNSTGWNLWKEEPECLEWLDSEEPRSVIYVNFGSIAVVTKEQLIELGMGLANSNHSFLWIIRPDMVRGDSVILRPEFEERRRGGRGLIASWCSQEEVLHHPSIGGFFTHCGWNSVLESVIAGAPMLCQPFSADQITNCKYACDEWGIGMEIRTDANRDEVEKLVKELMEGERGKKLKDSVVEWKKMAEEATSRPNGSSYVSLDKVMNQVLLSKKL